MARKEVQMKRFAAYRLLQAALLATGGLCSLGVSAEEGFNAVEASAPPVAASPFARKSESVDGDTLSQHRGGAVDLLVNDQKLASTVQGNQASNLITGANVISEGAFAGTSGLPMVIQNSGNNVSIQNATVLNVSVK